MKNHPSADFLNKYIPFELKLGKYFCGNWGKLSGKNEEKKKRRKKWEENKGKPWGKEKKWGKTWANTSENDDISVKMRKIG